MHSISGKGGQDTADKRTRDAPVRGTSLLFWSFFWEVPGDRSPAVRRDALGACFVPFWGGEVGKESVPAEHQGVRDRDLVYRQSRRRDAAPGGDKMQREVPPAVSGGASLKRASWGLFRRRCTGERLCPCPCPSAQEAGHRRPRESPSQASCLRPRRPDFRTRRAGPADRASCRRAGRPCGKGVPDIAPDPSLVPRAPAAGRPPGACPGAAAGRGGR